MREAREFAKSACKRRDEEAEQRHDHDALAFNQEIHKAGAKNYHTWSQPELWAGELPFVERLLSEDVWNHFAWHHRSFVTSENGDKAGAGDGVVRHENFPCHNGDVLVSHRAPVSSVIHLKVFQEEDCACAKQCIRVELPAWIPRLRTHALHTCRFGGAVCRRHGRGGRRRRRV